MRVARQLALGLVIIAALVVAVVGVQVVPSLVAPSPTPRPPTATSVPRAEFVRQAQAFDGDAAMVHVRELASDRYDGRRAGTQGGQRTAEYIAARFRDYGLQPAGDVGTYFQSFGIDYLDLTATPELAILNADGSVKQAFRHHQDFREVINGPAGGGTIVGQLAYLGDANAVDFSKIDVKGRVVICQPASALPAVQRAANGGATAALVISRNDADILSKGGYAPVDAGRAIPCLKVSASVADKLLRAAGRSLDSASSVGEPFLTSVSVRVSVPLAPPEQVTARNVLGLLPGADPARANKVVIVGAHFDHLGRDPGGTLYPGAIDDASGVAVLLEIARLWHDQGIQPRMSVLFVAWDAEEASLLGSAYYVTHPRYPLDRTIGMIQLDCVSGGGDLLSMTESPGPLRSALLDSASDLNLRLGITNLEGGSDQAMFDSVGVPAALLIWANAEPFIHVPTDTPAGVRADQLRQTGAITALALLRLSIGEPSE